MKPITKERPTLTQIQEAYDKYLHVKAELKLALLTLDNLIIGDGQVAEISTEEELSAWFDNVEKTKAERMEALERFNRCSEEARKAQLELIQVLPMKVWIAVGGGFSVLKNEHDQIIRRSPMGQEYIITP